ncbi:MAG: hypothetical protein OEW91_06505, partial [Acidimicrobiia bacterium]|nr:hypothetical protein [Acidimicrobiia bacterium]
MVNGRTPTAGRIIGVVTLAVALFEVTRSALLFGFFGVGSEKDLIDAAFVVPDLLLVVFGGAHLIVALRPMLEPGDEPDADWEVRRATMASLRLVSLSHAAATIVAISLAQPLAATLFPALSETDRIAGMMRTSLAAHMLAAVTIVLFIAESTRNPRSPAWLMAAFQIAGFGLGGILGGSDRTPESFVWGLLVGSAVAVAVAAWRFERAG